MNEKFRSSSVKNIYVKKKVTQVEENKFQKCFPFAQQGIGCDNPLKFEFNQTCNE